MPRTASIIFLLLGTIALSSSVQAADEKFIVHEWGVMITGGAAAGEPMELSPPGELYTSLPMFVLRHDQSYKPRRQNFGWDKPVIHFYGPQNLEVKVQVGTPLGKPLAYWPPPEKYTEKMGKQISSRKEQMVYAISEATGMIWIGKLSAEPAMAPSPVNAGHWWSNLRGIDGARWFNTAKGSERFLFYEATAKQQPAVVAAVSADALVLRNDGKTDSGKVIVLINDGESRWMTAVENIAAGANMQLSKADLTKQPSEDEQVLSACRAQWRSMGMSDTESAAIVQTWESDLLHRVGFLVCARMPLDKYETMFPLGITPQPDERVRVGMVFDVLPGQNGRLSWLPGLQKTLKQWGDELGDTEYQKREAAAGRFARLGDLAKPCLEELMRSSNPEVSRAATVELQRLNAKPATEPTEKIPPEAHRLAEPRRN